ncbi:5'-3' exoribonuclease 1 isoform X2 [Pseudomyrmex gracilis]|uniref:5'-3' exoribonuclease 1 isoform X2 n=1 Tax=Pseudomyrmex gracilis TaxID=219809 RepID=UPI000995141F|nr:5'-3' exoribonuclease 1 isoform X2 [Pseudomyrmex gracilis]
MGVPKFFRYISERYPCLWELIKEHQIPEFDYLYLDTNGIIHTCSHPNDSDVSFRITEENIFKNIFHYIEVLFNMIRPKKLFFLAIDGVAPRAKINQQRGRRFRAAKDAEMQEIKAMKKGIVLPKEKRFDSNCITPGTSFMAKLGKQLKRFIEQKISTDDNWKKCKVMFSGCEMPGEGEHKIMDYIRFMKASKDYDSNSRHCLYGLDADLIMLGLCTHEPNFSLLREEVKFGKQQQTTTPERTKFCLLHLSLLREYIEHEFSPLKDKLPFPFDTEKIIDDWVLMGFLVGNDFIPHLPNLHINRGALPILYRAYMEVLPTLKGYINESGTLNLEHFEKFMEKLSSLDVEQFKEHYADLKYFESKTGRKSNESERLVYKTEDDEIVSPRKTKNKDLDALIKSTTDMCLDHSDDDLFDDFLMDMDMIDDESDSEVYTMEFVQHKKDYYMNKLEYDNVDAEVLRSQAEGYVRAIQWNLHYYYHGCCSWSWYYPHHYAPYISDIKDFKNLKLEFDLGEPFLPFQQLLAVLPAYSKDLLPEAFQSLLTEESSPIISYYPNNFKTDLNGKQQEWEAVVLIPFIDEKQLLAAMQPHLSKLTTEEQARNKHGPMCLYSYTEEIQNVYQETIYFPQFTSHAQVQLLHRDDIFVLREKLIRGLSPGFDLSLYYPGFPTMRHLRHTAHLEKAKVKVFQQASSGENMILRIESEETPNLESLASELLGKSVYVEWPNLKEALVVSVSDSKMRITLINHLDGYNPDNIKKENMKNMLTDWNAEKKTIKETHMLRRGIDIGDTSVLLHARLYLGNRYVFDDHGKVMMEKQWSEFIVPYAYQTIVTDISTFRTKPPVYESVHNIFIPGTFCFMLGHPYYGAMGEVMQNKDNQKRRIKVSIKIAKEPIFDHVKQVYLQQKTRYMHGSTAAQRLGISSHLLSRITGTIYVIQAANEEFVKHNVGLNLKFNKKNEEVSGYTRKDNGQWLYSPKAVQLIRAYMEKCPELFNRLQQNVMTDIFQEEELFGKTDSKELQETIAWLKEELRGMESRTCGMDALEPDLVKEIEEEVNKYLKSEDSKPKIMFMQVKPQLLFKPGLHLPNVPPDPNSQNRLFDRICCVRNDFTVPLGTKGTIIGTRNNATDTVYDVLFDKPFIGGLALNGCSAVRGYHLTASDFINISFGERIEQGNVMNELTECRKQTISNTTSFNKKSDKLSHPQMQLAKIGLEKLSRDIRMSMMQRGEIGSNSKITSQKIVPQHFQNTPTPNQASEFQALWDELHKIQKPNEAPEKPTVLSMPMKIKPSTNHIMQSIPDVNTQTSEQQNKMPTQNTMSSRKVAISQKDQTSKPPPLVQQLFDRARRAEEKKEKANSVWYTSQLMRHFSQSRFGLPKYNYILDEKTGLITARIMLENSKVYTGDPCATHEQATESVAKKVYETLNLNKAPDAKMIMAPRQQWYNSQPNIWVQNVRHPVMNLPKISPISQNLPMQRNTFYPRWNQNLPSTAAFVQTTLYNQKRHAQVKQQGQQQVKQQGYQQVKQQMKQGQQKNSQKEESKVERKNSTAFVPLQAQKNSRNMSAKQIPKDTNTTAKNSSSKTQQRQKKEEASPKKEKSENPNKMKETASSVLQQMSQQPQQNVGKLSKPRKSRVAAKFGAQPLMNGGEPSK